jgi:hypothetical protein
MSEGRLLHPQPEDALYRDEEGLAYTRFGGQYISVGRTVRRGNSSSFHVPVSPTVSSLWNASDVATATRTAAQDIELGKRAAKKAKKPSTYPCLPQATTLTCHIFLWGIRTKASVFFNWKYLCSVLTSQHTEIV